MKTIQAMSIAWCAMATIVLVGCSPKTSPTSDANTTTAATSAPSTEALETAEGLETAEAPEILDTTDTPSTENASSVEVEVVDVAGYEAAIAELKGKVVLVDFWATWCLPCMERFPETVAWSNEHEAEGLQVISVSMDSPDDVDSVKEFLAEQKADFRHLISQWGVGLKSMENFKIQGGGVPYYRLYDREGTLRYEFSGSSESYENVEALEQIESRMKELLAEPAA
jgi:thiol-disulfide isomerase/thioredoxin